jgi:hypothetical protein
VITIGVSAFYGCASLTNIIMSTNVTYIDTYVFLGCSSLNQFNIPNKVVSLGEAAFGDCNALTNVNMGNSLANIGRLAFSGCSNLSNVLIPNTVTNIGDNAFVYCYALTEATIGKGVTSYGTAPFMLCPLKRVYFLGDAPMVPLGFSDMTQLIVYYLPGTSGWGTTFDGRPALVISMSILTNDASFGLHTNQFGFNVAGSYGLTLVVEADTNLNSPVWYPLQTNTLLGTSFYFSDPQWTNQPNRFYRVRWP